MILKSTRISTSSGSAKVGSHVLAGGDNEEIHVLHGSPEDLDDMVSDARDVDAKYCMRHVIISPKEATTREQAQKIAADWRAEFGAGDRPSILVEHKKARADGSFDRHWHMLVAEVSPTTGRVLDNRADYARHEKLSRLAELELGHELVAGRHNAAVFHALNDAGKTAQADALRHLMDTPLPHSAFTSDAFQIAKRKGSKLSQVREQVRTAWERSDDARSFSAALAEIGLSVEQGRKKPIVVGTDRDGSRIEFGSVDRLVKVSNATVVARMSTQENEHVRDAEVVGRRIDDEGRAIRGSRGTGNGGREAKGANGHRDANGSREVGRPERYGADHRTLGTSDRRSAADVSASGRHRLGACRIERGATPQILSRLDALKSTAATIGKQRGGALSAASQTGGGSGGGSFGGGGGRSMDDIIKQQNGIQDASTGGGGGDGAPIAEGPDPEDLAKASEAFTEAFGKLWRRFFGGKSEAPPSRIETDPPPPGGGTGTGEPVHAVAAEAKSEEPIPADPVEDLGRDLAAYMRKIDRGTLKDGKLLAENLDRQPEGERLRKVIDAMHGNAELSDFAKRLPKSAPPSEIIRKVEEEARRQQREAEQRQQERTQERTQQMRGPTAPALRMGR